MARPGVYGGTLKLRLNYIRRVFGVDGVQQIFARMAEKGYLGPDEISMIGDRVVFPIQANEWFLESVLELHGDDHFDRMAQEIAKGRGLSRFLISYVFSFKKTVKLATNYWKNYWTVGELRLIKFGGGEVAIELVEVHTGPLMCRYLEQYFLGAAAVTGQRGLIMGHSACIHRGDDRCRWDGTYDE